MGICCFEMCIKGEPPIFLKTGLPNFEIVLASSSTGTSPPPSLKSLSGSRDSLSWQLFSDAEVDGSLQAAALPPRENDGAPVGDAASSTALQSQGRSDFDDWQLFYACTSLTKH